jgi:hypothetical protein
MIMAKRLKVLPLSTLMKMQLRMPNRDMLTLKSLLAVSDALEFNPEQHFQNIISLETIEHLPHPAAFVQHMAKLLETGWAFYCLCSYYALYGRKPFSSPGFHGKFFQKNVC